MGRAERRLHYLRTRAVNADAVRARVRGAWTAGGRGAALGRARADV